MWFNDWKTLVDAGDGASQALGYKIRKIDTVLLTHAHRDHIGGLLQVINQRGEAGSFTLAHPTRGRAWRDMEAFSLRFNPGSSHSALWRPLEEGDWLETGVEGRLIKSFRTRHFSDDEASAPPRSLGFHLVWRKNKLKSEFQNLSQTEIRDLALSGGKEAITEPVDEKWITVSGDGCPLSPDEVRGTKLLVHEATFLSPEDYDAEEAGEDIGHMHSTIFDALRVAHEADVERVVLYHISTRYTDQEIRDAVREAAQKLGLKAPVWALLPRRVYWDVFKDKPVWGV